MLRFTVREKQLDAATKETYTYEDYLLWSDEERWELIDGVPYNMTPAPSRVHQGISMELSRQIANHLAGKMCKIYAAPFDVRLPKSDEEEEQIETVVQPDLVVVCDGNKLDERGCKGAPDLIIEILSPYTAGKDMKIKRNLYEDVTFVPNINYTEDMVDHAKKSAKDAVEEPYKITSEKDTATDK